jgi:hypothetical protein
MKEITLELIERTKKWLGKDGKDFFTGLIKDHGEINCVYMEGGIPHPVHFREGMQVRNFLRGTGLCEGWDAHDFDDNWINIIEKAIKD